MDNPNPKDLPLIGPKLRATISTSRRGGTSTPAPSWKLEEEDQPAARVSARRLAANLWEVSAHAGPRRGTGRRRREKGLDLDGVADYNQAITPVSSVDLKDKLRESRHGLKTSAELLKVLNRIWRLEEQNASNLALVKALKLELAHANAQIRDLVEEQLADRHEIDELMKQVAEERSVRKTKERENVKVVVQSVKDEVEGERRLRKHSESLHRKLAKELGELKSSYSMALQDLEKERNTRELLENLCDEFAKGIGDYEKELLDLRKKYEKDYIPEGDKLILHISEAWLDQRIQMKFAEVRGDSSKSNTTWDRLGCEIKNFLQARLTNLRRQSRESVHLNEAISAPQDAEDDDSMASDLHCFELRMGNNGHIRGNPKQNQDVETEKIEAIASSSTTKRPGHREMYISQGTSSSNMNLEEHNDRSSFSSGNKILFADTVQGIHVRHSSRNGGGAKETEVASVGEARGNGHHVKVRWNGMDESNQAIKNFLSGQNNFLDGPEIHPCNDFGKDPGDIYSVSSPVQQWNYRGNPDFEVTESSSKPPRGMKDNSLKAKLLEVRLEGQYGRLGTSKVS